MTEKIWFFIDIDDTIMPGIFTNGKFYTNKQEKIETIINAYQKAKNIELYPEFIEWYKRTTSNPKYDIDEIYFTTGRQSGCFGWLTEKQLEPLQKIHWYHVYYFYEFTNHSWEIYKNFKIHTVINHLEFSDFHGTINIYDNFNLLEDYQKALDRPFNFFLITKPKDWNLL